MHVCVCDVKNEIKCEKKIVKEKNKGGGGRIRNDQWTIYNYNRPADNLLIYELHIQYKCK